MTTDNETPGQPIDMRKIMEEQVTAPTPRPEIPDIGSPMNFEFVYPSMKVCPFRLGVAGTSMCIGEQCMMWRVGVTGYCGMAGTP